MEIITTLLMIIMLNSTSNTLGIQDGPDPVGSTQTMTVTDDITPMQLTAKDNENKVVLDDGAPF